MIRRAAPALAASLAAFGLALALPGALAMPHAEAAISQPRPATAQHSEGSTLRAPDLRVAAIGYRLALAGRDLCPMQGPVTGMQLHHLAEYERADRPAMIAAGLGRGPGVLAVVAGSPAEAAGLRAGDVLLAVNGAAFPSPAAIAANPKSQIWRPLVEAAETLLFDQLARGPVTLNVLRAGETFPLTLTPRTGCLLRVRLAYSNQRTAVANAPYVVVSSGLLGLVRNDDELAFVIAHEMAHVVLGHGAELRAEGVPREGMARGLGKNGERVRRTEREADQLGGRVMLAAGYDPARGALILPRLGPAITFFGLFQTHDDDADRIQAMRDLTAAGGAR